MVNNCVKKNCVSFWDTLLYKGTECSTQVQAGTSIKLQNSQSKYTMALNIIETFNHAIEYNSKALNRCSL